MGEQKKLYLVELFIKLTQQNKSAKIIIDFNTSMLKITYSGIPDEIFKEIEKKYDINEYVKRIKPIIYEYFSEEELQSLVSFYSSFVGKKLLELNFLGKLKMVIEDMNERMEKELCQKKKIQ